MPRRPATHSHAKGQRKAQLVSPPSIPELPGNWKDGVGSGAGAGAGAGALRGAALRGAALRGAALRLGAARLAVFLVVFFADALAVFFFLRAGAALLAAFFLVAFRFDFFAIIVLPFLLPVENSVGPVGDAYANGTSARNET